MELSNDVAIYTAMFGKMDNYYDPLGHLNGIDKFYFTDLDIQDKLSYPITRKKADYLPPVRRHRRLVVCIPSVVFDNYDYSILVSTRLKLAVDPRSLLDYMDSDVLLFGHSYRDCVYDEARACISAKKDNPETIQNQMEHYKSRGYPSHNGLYSTGCMVRKHTPGIKELSDSWWAEIEQFSHRDQLSLPYVLWKIGMPTSIIPNDKKVDTFIQERILRVGH